MILEDGQAADRSIKPKHRHVSLCVFVSPKESQDIPSESDRMSAGLSGA